MKSIRLECCVKNNPMSNQNKPIFYSAALYFIVPKKNKQLLHNFIFWIEKVLFLYT